jgi:hypothetical protein
MGTRPLPDMCLRALPAKYPPENKQPEKQVRLQHDATLLLQRLKLILPNLSTKWPCALGPQRIDPSEIVRRSSDTHRHRNDKKPDRFLLLLPTRLWVRFAFLFYE